MEYMIVGAYVNAPLTTHLLTTTTVVVPRHSSMATSTYYG